VGAASANHEAGRKEMRRKPPPAGPRARAVAKTSCPREQTIFLTASTRGISPWPIIVISVEHRPDEALSAAAWRGHRNALSGAATTRFKPQIPGAGSATVPDFRPSSAGAAQPIAQAASGQKGTPRQNHNRRRGFLFMGGVLAIVAIYYFLSRKAKSA